LLHLPRETGLYVLRKLRREKAATKVVLMADRLEVDDVLEAFRLGGRGMLLKELALEMIVQCIRRVLAGELWFEKGAVSRALDVLLRRENGRA
jgi:two-component system, NarL family, nitrate/nitrite response regulator NarL